MIKKPHYKYNSDIVETDPQYRTDPSNITSTSALKGETLFLFFFVFFFNGKLFV